jgi:tetratricopeptide (TPR) repeat protein
MTLARSGRFAEAEAEARTVAGARAWRKGDEYRPLALSLAALATGAQGKHGEALAAYDELLPVFADTFGTGHVQTLKLRSDRAQSLLALARYPEAEAECAAVGREAARGAGPGMALVATAARICEIFALNAQGRHIEAEAMARETLAARTASDRLSLTLRLGLARALNGQGRYQEALTEAEHADDLRRGLTDEQTTTADTGAVELVLANALLGLDRPDEARTRATAAHAACLSAFGANHYRTTEARTLLTRIPSP